MDPDGSPIRLAMSALPLLSTGGAAASLPPDVTNILWRILLLVVLLFCNAFFAGSEIAIISLNDNKLRRDAEQGNKKAKRLVWLTDNPSNFLATIQVGVTLSGFLASAVAATSFAEAIAVALAPRLSLSVATITAIATVLITLLLSFLTLVLGELVPKRIAMQRSEAIAYAVSGALGFIARVTRPFIWVLSKTANAVIRLVGMDPDAPEESVTEEEIRMMLDAGEEKGFIEESTGEMIDNIFEFDDITAGEVMTHRTEVEAVEDTDTIEDVIRLAIDEGYSRIPVFHEDIDDILGVIYVKDLLRYVGCSLPDDLPLAQVMRGVLFVPETKKCRELFEEMQQKKLQMAVVVDEYGGTAGIVTMEDLLESIVGNIQDEYDDEDEEMVRLSDTSFTIDGTTDLDEVSDLLDVSLPEGDYDTLGGMILEVLGYIPAPEEHPQVQAAGYTFTVESVEDRRIGKVTAEQMPETGEDAPPEDAAAPAPPHDPA